jgi:DNA-binding transcriptional LysR family regulator
MDLRKLEMLVAVVDAGSYSKAGERLNVSHSAIHRQIRLLENEFSERILVRTGRRVKLTNTGEILLDLSRRLEQEVAAAERQICERAQLRSGRLRIGTGTTMLVFFLPRVLDLLRKEYPGVEVQVMTGTADNVLEGIQARKLDVGVILGPRAPGSPPDVPYTSEVLYREELVVAVGKTHPLAKQKTVSLERLIEYPFITQAKTSHVRRVMESIFTDAGLTPKISMELENEEAMEAMIAINMGVALLSRRRAVSDRVHYLRIAGRRIYCDVNLVFSKSAYIPRTVQEFSRLCRGCCPGAIPSVPQA